MTTTTLPPLVTKARAFAIEAHGDQRYGDQPYVVHLDEVHAVLVEHGQAQSPDDVRAVLAYLHDVVEDTAVTLRDIGERFGQPVSQCVDLLTDAPGRNRKERKAATYARLAEVDTAGPQVHALVVKAADRLANVRRCVADDNRRLRGMYRGEHPTFRTAACRTDLATSLWDELDRLLAPSR